MLKSEIASVDDAIPGICVHEMAIENITRLIDAPQFNINKTFSAQTVATKLKTFSTDSLIENMMSMHVVPFVQQKSQKLTPQHPPKKKKQRKLKEMKQDIHDNRWLMITEQ